ncbi:MAG: PDDEXK nuclease domain-containing protein [Chlamydiales bacterium]
MWCATYELKAGEFDSRDAGQMSAYLSAVDDQLRSEGDKPTLGPIFCKTKDNIFVEYVLRNFNRPIGVAEFEVKLVENLPKDLKSSLPTIEEIEAELSVMPTPKKKKSRKKK